MREPTIFRWPGKVPAGKTCGEVACTLDLLPTVAALAGAKLPAGRTIDGADIGPLMTGQAGAKTPHEAFYYYSGGGQLEAVRSANWKLRVTQPRRRRKKKGAPTPAPAPQPKEDVELYDLSADIGEENNLADKHPDVVKRLRAMMKAFDAEVTKNARPAGRLPSTPRPKSKA
jgi:arylsulfatase A-like enzyme